MRRGVRSLAKGTEAIAALEFALIAPIFGILIIGTFDAAKAVILWAQVHHTAHFVATSATNVSLINADKTTTLSAAAAQQSMSVIYAEMPWIRNGIENGVRSVTLSSVEFKPVSTSCTQAAGQNCYNANIAWSVAYTGGQSPTAAQFQQNAAVLRACGPLTQTAPKAPIPGGLTVFNVLRTANVTQPDAVLVADVHYQYTPMFLRFITGPLDFWATSYTSVRIGAPNTAPGLQFTNYNGSAAGNATGNCTGL